MKNNILCKRPRSKEVIQEKIDNSYKNLFKVMEVVLICFSILVIFFFWNLFSNSILIYFVAELFLLFILIFIMFVVCALDDRKTTKWYQELNGQCNDTFERISLTEIEDIIEVDGDKIKIQPLINKNELYDYINLYLDQEDVVILKLIESENGNFIETSRGKQYTLTDAEFKMLKSK